MNQLFSTRLAEIANSGRWDEYVSAALEAGMSNKHQAIEAIFLLFRDLVYPKGETVEAYKLMMEALKHLFLSFNEKYEHDAEFLFFIGYLMALSEWAFSQEDFKRSHHMLRMASELEPHNLLYKWGYCFSVGDPSSCSLSDRLVSTVDEVKRLYSLGEAGRFIVDAIETADENCKSRINASP